MQKHWPTPDNSDLSPPMLGPVISPRREDSEGFYTADNKKYFYIP
jgi:hypothetical protein